MSRSARFWLRFSGQIFLIVGILVAIFGGYYLLWTDPSEFILSPDMLPTVLCFAATFSVLVSGTSLQLVYLPLTIAFGETRKNAFRGLMGLLFGIPLATALLGALCWVLHPQSAGWLGRLPVLFLWVLIGSHLGNLAGILYTKYRVVGLMLIGGFSAAFSGGISVMILGSGVPSLLNGGLVPLLIAGIAAVAADVCFSHRRIQSLAVQL